ncbi:putative DNA repair protein [Talaromyces proteolyticus]|uniref:Protein artemis n=1 Tax=Talaromyces proteolyticus TaxID=1131652 RepID=A0AAD4KYS0_9EURO|nr:putative DNA repair protein [Talaromyces proteolyticus]KAH8700541.1 putative DNA repair protein [Talaromyces proteolyticus]
MSTFNGIVSEFPSIRIDYFRRVPDKPAPLACFLSHVHSDHLLGLESLRSPFVYCSAVTKEVGDDLIKLNFAEYILRIQLLLRIEKYPHRMNFSKGILESRKQHYGHLAKLLRPIPLNTPTEIELTPLQRIRVTLFDANHCAGAVMFLIEDKKNAVLYTGDIRGETWWVNSLTRHPVLLPYTCGLKTLDTIYLDTTFAIKSHIYRTFPSKSEGIRELLEKVKRYPEETVFYLRAWTFGYEEVWQALSTTLNSKIHVDRYQYGLYKSLAIQSHSMPGLDAATFLCGFQLGNEFIPGCLTSDEIVRIHSCEPGAFCSSIKSGKSIFIIPVITRDRCGAAIPEAGAGGGKGDLYQIHELELPDEMALQKLEELLTAQIGNEQVISQTRETLRSAFESGKRSLSLDEFGLTEDADVTLKDLISMISKFRDKPLENLEEAQTITFPYSRHSSYAELCELVSAFKPRDVFPCTVDSKTWNDSVSMESLFGQFCSGKRFVHDKHMRETEGDRLERENKRARYTLMRDARHHLQAMGDKVLFQIGPLPCDFDDVVDEYTQNSYATNNSQALSQEPFVADFADTASAREESHSNVVDIRNAESQLSISASMLESEDSKHEEVIEGQPGTKNKASINRLRAYRAARTGTYEAWNEIAMVSAGNNHTEEETEL